MQEFSHAKREYDRFAEALEMVKTTGYGIAAPSWPRWRLMSLSSSVKAPASG